MNSTISLFTVLLLICSSNSLASVPSLSGHVSISGNILTPTCVVGKDSTPFGDSIEIPATSVDKISSVHEGVPIPDAIKEFKLKLQCDGALKPKLKFTFDREHIVGKGSPVIESLIRTTGSGAGISIGLLAKNDFVISGVELPMEEEAGQYGAYNYSLGMVVGAYRNGHAPKAGEVKATATVEVIEQ
ncbi:fimbrial protein [Salmonella enterica]|nr:fimbrial protein [Salmonella enterica]EIP6687078.1 fimbrial protein [Salmonella enterica subsp. enterica serovar Javiana]EIP6742424.1 fimbrial protein [Salmonella enterica subsp. enterica serovar Javiana]EIQ4670384.1 fimbrial protein [Salmonella enterica subsp. enterica serovar Javiana]EIR2402423.1 fimbrial protein [Salmonella enterica subsp. enterica serovar Javiana]